MSNLQTACKYFGCQIEVNGQIHTMWGILPDGIWYTENRTNKVAKWGEWKPILKPLSEITDEDAVEVARIMLHKDHDWNPISIERNECYTEILVKKEPDITDSSVTVNMLIRFWNESNKVAWVWEYIKGDGTGVDDRRVPNITTIIDYLRSRYYDIDNVLKTTNQ